MKKFFPGKPCSALWNYFGDVSFEIKGSPQSPYIKFDSKRDILLLFGNSSCPQIFRMYLQVFERVTSQLPLTDRLTLVVELERANVQTRMLITTFITNVKREFPDHDFSIQWRMSRIDCINDFGLELMEKFDAELLHPEGGLEQVIGDVFSGPFIHEKQQLTAPLVSISALN